MLKETRSNKPTKQKSIFAIQRKSTSRDFRICVTRPNTFFYIKILIFTFDSGSNSVMLFWRLDVGQLSCSTIRNTLFVCLFV